MPKILVPVPPSGVAVPVWGGYGVTGGLLKNLIGANGDTNPKAVDLALSSPNFGTSTITFPFEYSNGSLYAECRLYSGAKPSLSEVNIALLAGTYNTLYGPRKLLNFATITTLSIDTDTVNGNFTISCASTSVEKGVATGNATWWALCRTGSYNTVQFVGDVSAVGGTGEVQMANTNIVLNQDYILTKFSFRFPSVFDIAV